MEKQKIESKLLYNKHNSFVSFKGKYDGKVDQIKKNKFYLQ